MIRVKSRIFSGVVCEQEVYNTTLSKNYKSSTPRIRFKDEEERQRHKDNIARRDFIRLVNDNFTPSSLYVTLTFDTEHEIHCPSRKMKGKDSRYTEALTQAYKDANNIATNYIRRIKRKNAEAKIVLVMGQGETTDRIHFHMIIDGVEETEIINQWRYGCICRIENLREHNIYNGVDHGRDYTGLALYLINHWEPEQGSHRYKKTRNVRRPEREDAKICARHYTKEKAPIAPKGYILVEAKSNEYGYMYFKYVLDPEIQKHPDNIYRRKRQ